MSSAEPQSSPAATSGRENPERCFEHAPGAKSFRCVGKDFRAALSTNSNYSDHAGESLRIPSIRRIHRTLCPDYSDQMAQLIFDIAGRSNRMGNFLS